jgi:hypothetical protein
LFGTPAVLHRLNRDAKPYLVWPWRKMPTVTP